MSIKKVGNELRRWGVVCGVILGGLILVGCRTQPAAQHFAEVPPGVTSTSTANSAPVIAPVSVPVVSSAGNPAVTNSGGPEPEVFRVGDSLTVTFTDTPTQFAPFEEKIKEDGTITLLQNMSFTAAGMTPGDLAKEIRKRYVPDYYKYMTVTVKQPDSTRWYYVEGEVKGTSRQIYNSRITLLKAITSAGGFTDFANKKKVTLTRVDGRTMTVNCVKARSNPKLDPEVYPGDRIFVPRRIW
jgi:protein involved in polysaccharide export with SLBB domain